MLSATGVPQAFEMMKMDTMVYGLAITRAFSLLDQLRVFLTDPHCRTLSKTRLLVSHFCLILWLAPALIYSQSLESVACISLFELISSTAIDMFFGIKYHTRHLCDRFASYTVIVLGECIIAITDGINSAVLGDSLNKETIKIWIAGLLMILSLWWLYFLVPFGGMLQKNRKKVHFWMLGHVLLHGALVLFAAGLKLTSTLEGIFIVSKSYEDDSMISSNKATGLRQVCVNLITASMMIYIADLSILVSIIRGGLADWRLLLGKAICFIALGLVTVMAPFLSIGYTMILMSIPGLLLISFTITLTEFQKREFLKQKLFFQ